MATKTSVPENKYAVPALDKGLDVIEFLVTQDIARSQTEIAQALGRNNNEIYRVLIGLENRGYIIREEVSGKYRITLKIYNLSRRISPTHEMTQIAQPLMEDLANRLGHSCYLCMLNQSETMVLLNARSHSPISISLAEGASFSSSVVAAGQVLLANCRPDIQEVLLDRDAPYKKKSKKDKELFLKQLKRIRTKGYQSSENEITEGVSDLAVLIGEPDGDVLAALIVSTLNLKGKTIRKEDRAELLQEAQDTALQIATQIGSRSI